jgi:hypothetical protein
VREGENERSIARVSPPRASDAIRALTQAVLAALEMRDIDAARGAARALAELLAAADER